MGKVGSSSLRYTLPLKHKGAIIHAHSYSEMSFKAKEFLRWRRRLHLPIFVISPVREPISRNVSAFFQNFKRNMKIEFSDRAWTSLELRNLFLQYYNHNIGLEWFDRNLKPTFGIDIFTESFPIKKKWKTYRKGSVRILIYRSDLDHSKQLSVVSRFLNCEIDSWIYKNKSENKEYSTLYYDFCDTVKLPDNYILEMSKSKYFKHFWSEEEIDEYSKKWRAS